MNKGIIGRRGLVLVMITTVLMGMVGIGIAGATFVGPSFTADATVLQSTCSLSGPIGGVHFGSVTPTLPSSPQTAIITNNGNVGTTGVAVYGSNWLISGSGDQGAGSIGWTSWSNGGTYYQLAGTPGTPTGLIIAGNGGTAPLYFELTVPQDTPAGSASQTVTVIGSC